MTVDKEELARTMFEALTGDLVFWEDASEAKKEKFRKAVDATLASIEAQDHVIVPVEPTEEMINATIGLYGYDADAGEMKEPEPSAVYKAMIQSVAKGGSGG